MTDRRRDRYWPRDGPIRWDRFAARVAYQLLALVAAAAHLTLAFALTMTLRDGPVDWILAAAWIGSAIFAVWSWWFHRRRIVLAPLTLAGLAFLAGRLPG